mmetsp:Transcript_35069/g.75662  ORF Transcript_35069/g.75662 Transcript_35069/m.75662 type:complete len:233 (+) Transcript_35069:682-1380(+)
MCSLQRTVWHLDVHVRVHGALGDVADDVFELVGWEDARRFDKNPVEIARLQVANLHEALANTLAIGGPADGQIPAEHCVRCMKRGDEVEVVGLGGALLQKALHHRHDASEERNFEEGGEVQPLCAGSSPGLRCLGLPDDGVVGLGLLEFLSGVLANRPHSQAPIASILPVPHQEGHQRRVDLADDGNDEASDNDERDQARRGRQRKAVVAVEENIDVGRVVLPLEHGGHRQS